MIITVFASFYFAKAQTSVSITGNIVDEKGEPLKAATVFLSGTQKISVANDEGRFILTDIEPGTYQLIIKMLGYFPAAKNLIISLESPDIRVELQPRSINLKEVVIGTKGVWEENYEVFKENFLGFSKNAMRCEIINPKILNFNKIAGKGILTANTDDFLLIENRSLGYRIKYLLKNFEYNSNTETTVYDGETSFEELPGTEKQRKKYYQNRKAAYSGSLMHFLRSVYNNTVLKEGFITNQVYGIESIREFEAMRQFAVEVSKNKQRNRLTIDPRPVRFDTLISKTDSSLISLKFLNGLYVTYNPKKSLSTEVAKLPAGEKKIDFNWSRSLLQLHLDEALIDKRGSIYDYETFLIKGFWGEKRVGDQMPFEYIPID